MAKNQKSWREKLADSRDLPKLVKISPEMAGRWGAGSADTVVIPAPLEVDELMKRVPKGKLITINEIREAIARKHNKDGSAIGCPLTTGIFAWIAANAAEEARSEGKKNITPYWRTLKSDGAINEKYPGGAGAQKALLEKEGHRVSKKGKKHLVVDYKKHLAKL
jgi:hypothetical protein